MRTKPATTITAAISLAVLVSVSYGESQYERELNRLIEQRDRALEAATAPIHERFKGLAEQLLRRATQSDDLEAALKIREALEDALESDDAANPDSIRDLRTELAGTTWKTVAGTLTRPGLAETLTFTDESVEPGGYRYQADSRRTVTVIFTRGDTQQLTLARGGTQLQFNHQGREGAYELATD